MVTVRSANEIIQNLVDFFRLAQPDLDTKPGTVARDLFIEGPSSQISLLYEEKPANHRLSVHPVRLSHHILQ